MQSGVSFAGLFSRMLTGYATMFSRGYGHRVRLEQRMFGLDARGHRLPSLVPSSRCFSYARDWVEQRVRRHLLRARNRRGFRWTRWSRRWLYETLGLYNDYRVRSGAPQPRALATG
jgi:hypothetical protein